MCFGLRYCLLPSRDAVRGGQIHWPGPKRYENAGGSGKAVWRLLAQRLSYRSPKATATLSAIQTRQLSNRPEISRPAISVICPASFFSSESPPVVVAFIGQGVPIRPSSCPTKDYESPPLLLSRRAHPSFATRVSWSVTPTGSP